MTIKPIDLQTNIGQMLEVGKGEHARQGAAAELQHVLDKEANDKSNLINSKLKENEKAEKTGIREEDKKKDRYGHEKKREGEEPPEKEEKKSSGDDRMGRLIDVFK